MIHKTIYVLALITLLFGLSFLPKSDYVQIQGSDTTTFAVGPQFNCDSQYDSRLMSKTPTVHLRNYSECYDHDIEYLIKHDLLKSKVLWLKRIEGIAAVEDFLLDGLHAVDSNQSLHLMLAQLYAGQKRWHLALQHLDSAKVKVNDRLRLIVEAHVGDFSTGSDMSLVPDDLKDHLISRAHVTENKQQNFSLRRISDGNINTINGEPSMAVSSDGEDIWLTWTESGVSTVISKQDFYWWKIKSAHSTDAGQTWQFSDMNPLPTEIEKFHFDPMTAYDEDNQVFYAGLALKGFVGFGNSNQDNDGFYMYRWDANSGIQEGPFYTEILGVVDKGWLSVKDGDIYRTHNGGLDRSTDMAESFTHLPEFGTYLNPYHRINYHDNNCLFITDVDRLVTCDGNGQPVSIARNFSSITSPFNLFFAPDDDVPGTFRVTVSIHNVIHPNGEIYVVYSSYDQSNANDISLYMSKSSDNGMTWSAPWLIAANAGSDKIIPWVEVDDQGGLHVAYLDTRHGIHPDDSSLATLDLYYQYSNDLGLSWQEARINPTSLQVPELIWGDYFFSDYLSMNVENNTVNIAFPWSETAGQMHMYFAQSTISNNDVIFVNGFD